MERNVPECPAHPRASVQIGVQMPPPYLIYLFQPHPREIHAMWVCKPTNAVSNQVNIHFFIILKCTGWGKKNGQSTILYYVRGLFFSWHPVEYLKSYLLTIFLLKNTTSS